MPSRRRYLSGVITAGIGGIAGCSGYLNRTTGILLRKTISVGVPTSHGPVITNLAVLILNPDRSSVLMQYDPNYLTFNTEQVELMVSEEQYETLDQQFTTIDLIAGISPNEEDEWINAAMHRSDFNKVQIGGSVTVGEYWAEDGTGFLRLHNAESRQLDLSEIDVHRFNIEDRFEHTRPLDSPSST